MKKYIIPETMVVVTDEELMQIGIHESLAGHDKPHAATHKKPLPSKGERFFMLEFQELDGWVNPFYLTH